MRADHERAPVDEIQGTDSNPRDVWRPTLFAIGACMLALVLTYWDTYRSIVETWRRSETFAHGFVIVPIVGWLVWRSRAKVAATVPAPAPWGVAGLALLAMAWLVGWAANVLAVQHVCAIVMIPVLVFTLTGWTTTRVLAFPLAYLMLAAPVGEFLVPPLTHFTAQFTVGALQLLGVPVSQEGHYFRVPGGRWEISKACSGIRYLMATVAVGSLFAYLQYRTRRRQIAFVAISIAVPIVANGFRAVLIVMMGYLSDMKLATGIDHIVYGWIFFSIITLGLCWFGARWREPEVEAVPAKSTAPRMAPPNGRWVAVCAGAAAFTLLLAPATAAYLDRMATRLPPRNVALAPEAISSWSGPVETSDTWQPVFVEPELQVRCVYRMGSESVHYFSAFYGDQRVGSELINSVNRVYDRKTWKPVAGGPRTENLGGHPLPITETSLHIESVRQTQRRLVWHWYVVAGVPTTNPYFAKVLEARAKLQGKPRGGVVIAIAADFETQPEAARAILRQFLDDHYAVLEREWSRGAARTL